MIERRLCASYQELSSLSTTNAFVVYGDLDKHNNMFEIISVPEHGYSCGLMYYDHGVTPQILLLNNPTRVLIGFDNWLLGINCISREELFQQKTISLFYEFIKSDDRILSIHELDIFAFDLECRLVWSSGFRDIVDSYHLVDSKTISITCASGDNIQFQLASGVAISI